MAPDDYLQHIDFAATTKLDFTPLFTDPKVFRSLILDLCRPFRAANIDKVACPESMGFILGSAVAAELKLGLIPIRKAGKLPNIKRNVVRQRFVDYTGGASGFEVNKALIAQGDRILLIDDWVETGGQLRGLTKLLEKRGAVVTGISVLGFNTAGTSGALRDRYTLASILDYDAPDKRNLTRRLDQP
jgi:adenine phosphoribosyltransferase